MGRNKTTENPPPGEHPGEERRDILPEEHKRELVSQLTRLEAAVRHLGTTVSGIADKANRLTSDGSLAQIDWRMRSDHERVLKRDQLPDLAAELALVGEALGVVQDLFRNAEGAFTAIQEEVNRKVQG